MTPGPSRPLTDRQAAVMERIDRRVPIKVIAADLGVSETRINQHIRALKDHFDASSLGDLVEKYRAYQRSIGAEASQEPEQAPSADPVQASENQADRALENATLKEPESPLSEAVYSIPQVPATVFGFDMGDRDSAATVEMNDVLPLIERTPWLKPGEPKVVPGLLDGEHAILFRLAAIVGIAFGLLSAIILALTAAKTVSEALDGHAAVPVDEQGFT
ncbi:MAG: hypothetical protein AAF127_08400 [Pseudomonadota bacterium]